MHRGAVVARVVIGLFVLASWWAGASSAACTRALWAGQDGLVVTGRTMDWMEDLHTDLWAFPRGMKRHGRAGAGSIEWTSRYGSVIAAGYNAGSADGMNERGLVMNLLYLAESDYGDHNGKPGLSVSLWGQYALDNFATVAESVEALKKEPFRIVAPALPNGKASSLHLSLSDASGDSAIFQYVDGRLMVHHGRQFTVMTNSPVFDQQLALNAYWQEIGGLVMLPGTNRAADRFARACFYVSKLPQTPEPRQGVAGVFSVMRNVTVPLGISDPQRPNIATTIWTVAAEHRSRTYYFQDSLSPNICWVALDKLDLNAGSPARKLDLQGSPRPMPSGEVSGQFEPAQPFVFLGVD
ncbi:MAG TPA: hypothetical protein DEB06_00085 [Phycisphaerales bacterium]|nr:hypothetical protein [Phycisphaerales bacterium]